ncbi:MAG: tetratricopeptide repeat protein, partial [Planctomycetota bacterium]
IILPAHAALAWTEHKDGAWHTYLLQTGPAYEFVDPDLGRSLEQTYRHFDQTANFDPNAVGLLLRFSGENTRSSWRLSKRIFSDPTYAQTMIDVQRDWHYQTYLQGIEKMERLIASGDEDNANYRELAGLAAFTGQYAKAADYLDEAIERTPEETSRLAIRIEQANHLLEADKRERGVTLLTDIIEQQLSSLQQELGTGIIEIGLNLAGTCIAHDLPELAAQTMARTNLRMTQNLMRGLLSVLQRNPDHPAWQTDPRLRMARRMVRRSASTAIALLDLVTPEQIADNDQMEACRSLAEAFLQAVAFADIDDRSQIPQRYATAAAYYRAMMDPQRFEAQLAAATLPQEDRDHRSGRQRGLDQIENDLPWIKASVPYWSDRLSRLVDELAPEQLDRERVAASGENLEAAMTASRELDMVGATTYYHLHLGRLIVALLTEDAPALRALLAEAAAKGDKRLRDRTAQWIGDTAPFLDQEWFATVMDLWREELDYKPKYFWIAWRAAIAGSDDNALLAARRAAQRYPDDPAFVAEYRFMQQLLGAKDDAGS